MRRGGRGASKITCWAWHDSAGNAVRISDDVLFRAIEKPLLFVGSHRSSKLPAGCLPGWQPHRQLLASVKFVTGGITCRILLIGACLNV